MNTIVGAKDIRCVDDLPAGLAADQWALQKFLIAEVLDGSMSPTTAIEIYCEARKLPLESVLLYAWARMGFDLSDAILAEIEVSYENDNIKPLLECLASFR